MGTASRREIAWIGSYPIIKLMLDYLKIGNVTINIKIHDSVTIKDFGDRKKLSAYCENTILTNLLNTLHSKSI